MTYWINWACIVGMDYIFKAYLIFQGPLGHPRVADNPHPCLRKFAGPHPRLLAGENCPPSRIGGSDRVREGVVWE